MNDAPTIAHWPILQEFYQWLAQELQRQGVASLTTGGIACVAYDLAQATKDCDIIIPVEKAPAVLKILANLQFFGQGCHLTLKYGAPLDSRWLAGGWSTHTFFGDARQPSARLDLFGRPPRVTRLHSDEMPLYLSRGGVAQMKKTRREKDWAYANLLGHQMLMRGNPQGLLHIMDSQWLLKAAREMQISQNLVAERPVLQLAISGSSDLERHLKAEKEFWFRLDDLRLKAYAKAWVPYGQALQAGPELLNLDFEAQNREMVAFAERTLDPTPLETMGWGTIVQQASAETAGIFQNLDTSLLPHPDPFPASEP